MVLALVLLVFFSVFMMLLGIALLVAYRDDRTERRGGTLDLTGLKPRRVKRFGLRPWFRIHGRWRCPW